MATEETVLEVQQNQAENQDAWSGGKEPFKASYGKLMMWYFLLSDAFTFGGFLIAYGALRFSMPTWPLPDVVFSTLPGGIHDAPLIFVTIMTFILIVSSVTMVRAVQEGHRENKQGVAFWMAMTIIGGFTFLGCQAWEWNTLIAKENMSVTRNTFGTHAEAGIYLDDEHGHPYTKGAEQESFDAGDTYLLHAYHADHGADHGAHGDEAHGDDHGDGHAAATPNLIEDNKGNQFVSRRFETETGEVKMQEFGPFQFGALFFFITGFHGFHVFSGLVILLIVLLNVVSGIYVERKNGYEMVEKVGLYWHFVDLVWVFVFLVFYLL